MSTPAPARTRPRFKPGYRGFLAFCAVLGEDLAPFQRRIARAHFGADREVVAILPRGNAKSTTAALLALHHVATVERPSVFIGAGSREQARVIGRIVERFARHPALVIVGLQVRHDELRTGLRETVLQIVPSDGARAHGWERPTLIVADELWSWRDREPTMLGAMQTSMVKNPTCRFLAISTSAATLSSPLGRMRVRAMAQPDVRRTGALTEASGDGLRWLEWSLAEDESPDDPRAVARANPAPWISTEALRQQRRRVTDPEFMQFHCCAWGYGAGAWLPPGAWSACTDSYETAGEPVFVGVDIGGQRDATAVVSVTRDLRVATVDVLTGDEAVLAVADVIQRVAKDHPIREVIFDPWRFESEALRLEREHGWTLVQFPQSHARMTIASERLHAAIVEGRLRHPNDRDLNAHISAAIATQTNRGWRLDKADRDHKIDAAVALAMAVDRAGQPPRPPARVLGWL